MKTKQVVRLLSMVANLSDSERSKALALLAERLSTYPDGEFANLLSQLRLMQENGGSNDEGRTSG